MTRVRGRAFLKAHLDVSTQPARVDTGLGQPGAHSAMALEDSDGSDSRVHLGFCRPSSLNCLSGQGWPGGETTLFELLSSHISPRGRNFSLMLSFFLTWPQESHVPRTCRLQIASKKESRKM